VEAGVEVEDEGMPVELTRAALQCQYLSALVLRLIWWNFNKYDKQKKKVEHGM